MRLVFITISVELKHMKVLDADKLKDLREARGLKLREVAENTGISVQQLSNYENGHAVPTSNVLLTLLDFYKVTNFEVQKNYTERVISA
jgi:transcriptional regulator with XRE-family HTH domain